ncbi:MAG TPA: hypothetical protein VJB11_01220 [archaeon]|nr:hypothetical protein [archaeon]
MKWKIGITLFLISLIILVSGCTGTTQSGTESSSQSSPPSFPDESGAKVKETTSSGSGIVLPSLLE